MKGLNIGCGWDKKEGYTNIDISPEVKPDIIVNIEDGLPFKDNQFNRIYTSHCIEHVRPDKWWFVLEEIMRVAENKCILEILVPFDNTKKRTNIGHYRTFSYWSFSQYYITEKKRRYYSGWKLEPLHKEDNILLKMFYLMFPILKKEIYYKFMIVKNGTKMS